MKRVVALCAFAVALAASGQDDERIPQGKLGFPLGKYLVVEGVRVEEGKCGTCTLLVDTVNGKKLSENVEIWVDNVDSLPPKDRCVLRGYESGKMIGVPSEVADKERLMIPQACWQFRKYFIVTSVAKPQGLTLSRHLRRIDEDAETPIQPQRQKP